LCDERGEIESHGARLLFIGSGSPRQAGDFAGEHCPGVPVYSDPATATYRALGTARGVATTLGPSSLRAGLRAMRQGFRQGATKGNPWVQGAVLVVGPGDRVGYRFLSSHSGDHPPTADVLAAVREATASATG